MKMPNYLTSELFSFTCALVILSHKLLYTLAASGQPRANDSLNEIPTVSLIKEQQQQQIAENLSSINADVARTRDVINLKLAPDFRSMKLHWTYEQTTCGVWPAAFRIRYCELTSWMAEIKCRHDIVQVAAPTATSGDNLNSTVIKQQQAHIVTSGGDAEHDNLQTARRRHYETQVFDLRALTNYTFNVRVARFIMQPINGVSLCSMPNENEKVTQARTLHASARRLDAADEQTNQIAATMPTSVASKLAAVETTRPFSATAVRCLANTSEVLVQTGKYFGGRISVEGQTDNRCQLFGNKTSEQSAYTFRIDHIVCRSKVTDNNRVESMILVHENKDILTHNTARFLVVCNVSQKSFTVKASISLPKVNNLNAYERIANAPPTTNQRELVASRRPATITSLGAGKRPRDPTTQDDNNNNNNTELVRLGSMPGVYRPLGAASVLPANNRREQKALASTWQQVAGDDKLVQASELQFTPAQLDDDARTLVGSGTLRAAPVTVPAPVDVSSKLLFVERSSGSSGEREPRTLPVSGRLSGSPLRAIIQQVASPAPAASIVRLEHAATTAMASGVLPRPPFTSLASTTTTTTTTTKPPTTTLVTEQSVDTVDTPTVFTNNHRVAGNYLSLEQVGERRQLHAMDANSNSTSNNGQLLATTIKYSPAKVDEYALESVRVTSAPRSRSGRMRQIVAQTSGTTTNHEHHDGALEKVQLKNLESRMGDSREANQITSNSSSQQTSSSSSSLVGDLSVAESSSSNEQRVAATNASESNVQLASEGEHLKLAPSSSSSSLAHNITGALLRWSLRTLGTIARKSLETLVNESNLVAQNDKLASSGTAQLGDPFVQFNAPTSGRTQQQHATDAEELSDGFLIGQPRTPQHHTKTPATSVGVKSSSTATQQVAQHNTPLNSNVTQHLKRVPSQASRTTSTGPLEASGKLLEVSSVPMAATQLEAKQQMSRSVEHEHERSPAANQRSMWPLYWLWALIGLVALALGSLYFAIAPFGERLFFFSDNKHTTTTTVRDRAANIFAAQLSGGRAAQVVPNAKSHHMFSRPAEQHNNAARCDTLQRNLLFASSVVVNEQRPTSPASSLVGTRSTSAASTTKSMSSSSSSAATSTPNGEENYCKNQEQYVYTDCIFLTSPRDSTATRHSNESFA